jgi:hypothetical protein
MINIDEAKAEDDFRAKLHQRGIIPPRGQHSVQLRPISFNRFAMFSLSCSSSSE